MRVPVGIPTCPITGMHDGIKVTNNYPWGACVLGAFLREVGPKRSAFSWGVMVVDKSESNGGRRGRSSDFTSEPLGRGGEMGEGEFMKIPADKDTATGRTVEEVMLVVYC